MTIYNINILTPNTTHLYPVKASIGEPTYDYIQCPPSEAEGIAVLRYIPAVAEIVAGEFYANNTALKSFIKFPVDLTVVNVPTVDVYMSTSDPLDDPLYVGWLKVGNALSSVGTQFGLLGSDVPVNSSIWVMVKDTASTVYAISLPSERRGIITVLTLNGGDPLEFAGLYTENTKYFYGADGAIVESTDLDVTPMFYGIGNANKNIDLDIKEILLTMDTPVLTAGVEGTIIGTHTGNLGWFVDVYYRVHDPEGEWQEFEMGVAVDALGDWTATGTIADADTYDFMAEDTLVGDAGADVTGYDIEVVSGQNDGLYMFTGPSGANYSKYSTDYGVNFNNTNNSGVSVQAIAPLANGDWAYYAAYQKIMKITKAGVSSTLLTLTGKTAIKIYCSDNGQYALCVMSADGVWVTSNYGVDWTQLSTGISATCGFVSGDGSKMGYFISGGRPYFSNDYGANFTQRDTANRGWWNCCSSFDGSVVYATFFEDGKINKFTNNGATRTEYTTPNYNLSWHKISCSSNGSTVICSINAVSQVIAISTDYGVNYSYTSVYGNWKALKLSPDGTKLLACNTNGKAYLSSAPFSSFVQISADNASGDWAEPQISNDNKYMICGYSGKWYTTQDYGATWITGQDNAISVALNNKRT